MPYHRKKTIKFRVHSTGGQKYFLWVAQYYNVTTEKISEPSDLWRFNNLCGPREGLFTKTARWERSTESLIYAFTAHWVLWITCP